jgi:murein DD-endopeptidase MepM/ murein hydrolase activator NlpD
LTLALAAAVGTALLTAATAGGMALRTAAADGPPASGRAVVSERREVTTAAASVMAALQATATPPAGATAGIVESQGVAAAAPTATPADAPPAEGRATAAAPQAEAADETLVRRAAETPAAPAQAQLERTHAVSFGETLTSIAQRYGVKPETLLLNNPHVADRDVLPLGLTLRVPARDGLLYQVRAGDSVGEIAGRFGVEASTIVSEPANGMSSGDMLRPGQVVLVPGVSRQQPPLVPATPPAATPQTAAPTATPPPAPLVPASLRQPTAIPAPLAPAPLVPATPTATPAPARTATPQPAAPAAPPRATTPQRASAWIWPITGPLSSYFGPTHPLGIDIDLYGRAGAPIVAARAGTVIFAGGNPCCSYGYYVQVDHGDGFMTLYAHFQAPPPVKIGQRVEQGQVVGYAGTTGNSTGVHLHFELRWAGVAQNPLHFLP